MTIRSIPFTGFGELVVNAGDGPTMIINRDLLFPIYIGSDNSVASKQGTGDVDIIDPLSYMCFDGSKSLYAIAGSINTNISIDIVKGATTWAPSPAQAAQQISLLGLATATNQGTQITAANATNTVLNTGIAIPVGAAKDTSVNAVNTSVGVGNNTTAGINANHAGLQSMQINPFFTAPNGNSDLSGWAANGGTPQTAGINGAVALPAGSGFANGFFYTPNNTTNHPIMEPGGNSVPMFAVSGNQTVAGHFLLYVTSIANTPLGIIEISSYTSTGTFISSIFITAPIVKANQWFKVTGIGEVPANAALCQVAFGIQEAGNVPATDTFYGTAAVAMALGSPGSIAGDHAQHIANTGVPLLINRNFIYNQSFTVPGTGGTTTLANVPVGQIGYDGNISLTAAGTNVTTALVSTQIIVTWFEGATVIDAQTYEVYAGTTGVPHNLYIKGPSRGTSVTISFGNNNSGITINGTIQMFNTGRIYAYDLWRTNTGLFTSGTGAGLANAPYGTNYGLICLAQAAALAAGATSAFVLPLFTGKVVLGGSSTSDTTDMQIFSTDTIGPFGGTVFNKFSDAQGIVLIPDYALYNTQQTVSLRNGNAAAKTLSVNIVAQDY